MASLPYPRSQNNTPTEFTEHTEQTGREYSPTEFTDLHRYLLPQNSRNTEQTGREYSPTEFTDLHRYLTPTEFTEFTEQTGREYSPTEFTDLHRYLLPQNSRNSQNRLAKNIIPQISQIYTDIYSHRIHGTHRIFCLHLCKSVKSVGEHCCSRVHGYGMDAIPSYKSVGVSSQQ